VKEPIWPIIGRIVGSWGEVGSFGLLGVRKETCRTEVVFTILWIVVVS